MSSVLGTFIDNTGRPLRYHCDDSVVVFLYYQHPDVRQEICMEHKVRLLCCGSCANDQIFLSEDNRKFNSGKHPHK